MKINAFADVSLRALMVLAAAPEADLLTTQAVADAVGTPYNHVSKAMAKLRMLGLIDVERGRNGGSRLSAAGDSRLPPAGRPCPRPRGVLPRA
jgi:Rrf2 family nitric oxide-sensitive transcriptional repressor